MTLRGSYYEEQHLLLGELVSRYLAKEADSDMMKVWREVVLHNFEIVTELIEHHKKGDKLTVQKKLGELVPKHHKNSRAKADARGESENDPNQDNADIPDEPDRKREHQKASDAQRSMSDQSAGTERESEEEVPEKLPKGECASAQLEQESVDISEKDKKLLEDLETIRANDQSALKKILDRTTSSGRPKKMQSEVEDPAGSAPLEPVSPDEKSDSTRENLVSEPEPKDSTRKNLAG